MPTDQLSSTSTPRLSNYSVRNPTPRDAKEILNLVRESGTLDENSCYAYLLLCDHFRDTCLVAETEDKIAGFVAAYRPPTRPQSVFVWQIGVALSSRKHGLAKYLLRHLLALPATEGVRFLEATVTPPNVPSQRLFKSFADEVHAPLEIVTGFESEHFDTPSHEEESLFRIGPIRADLDSINS